MLTFCSARPFIFTAPAFWTRLSDVCAVLLGRPSVYAARGYGSIFNYCTQALKLSEDAACNRIETAKACRRFPVLFDHLESGAMTLSSIRLLGRHLTEENHEAAIERAKGCTLSQVATAP